MPKKFDVVIGNPPYQEEAQGAGTRDTPIYHRFMDAAYEVGVKVVLITPARFLFHAGFTPKAWNEKMLADDHLSVAYFEPDSNQLFPSLADTIKGGVAVTYRDSERKLGPIDFFTGHPELNTIMRKVLESGAAFIEKDVSSGRAYSFTKEMHNRHPEASRLMSNDAQVRISTNTFEQLSFLYHENRPNDGCDYVRILGVVRNRRALRWIRSDFLVGPDSLYKYKVAIPAANGSGSTTDFFGVALNNPTVLEPGVAVTQTFITIGSFESKVEAHGCLRYIKSKFARTMLGILKITQHNPAKVWKYVPRQDFSGTSDIDWTKSIPDVDAQLYAKYKMDDGEIAFIEASVKPME